MFEIEKNKPIPTSRKKYGERIKKPRTNKPTFTPTIYQRFMRTISKCDNGYGFFLPYEDLAELTIKQRKNIREHLRYRASLIDKGVSVKQVKSKAGVLEGYNIWVKNNV